MAEINTRSLGLFSKSNHQDGFTHFPKFTLCTSSFLPRSCHGRSINIQWSRSHTWLATNSFISFIKAGSFIRAHRCEKKRKFMKLNETFVLPYQYQFVPRLTSFELKGTTNSHSESFSEDFSTPAKCIPPYIFYFGPVRKVQTQRVHWGVPVCIQQRHATLN